MVVAACWLAFVVVERLLAERVWFATVPRFLPPPAFLLVPVLLLGLAVPARGVRRWVAAAALVSLVLGAAHSGLTPRTPWSAGGDGPAPPGSLRVLVWNTQLWDQDDDPDEFYAYLARQHADVYLLQEYAYWVDRGPRAPLALDRLRGAFPGSFVAVSGELVTVSRVPLSARVLPGLTPDRVGASRVLRTDLRLGSRGSATLSVYNVHLSAQMNPGRNPLTPAFHDSVRLLAQRRIEQFRLLRADLAANDNPVLVAGDFNTALAPQSLDGHRDLRDANRAGASWYPATWPAASPLWRLDWTFTAGVRVHTYALGDPRGMSDHRAQTMVVSVPHRQ